MPAQTLENFEKHLKFAWGDRDKSDVAMSWFPPDGEVLDPDWWEPRHDAPWRRQDARARAFYGAKQVAAPKPPIEGPNNPNRLRREFETAQRDLADLLVQIGEEEAELDQLTARVSHLKERLDA